MTNKKFIAILTARKICRAKRQERRKQMVCSKRAFLTYTVIDNDGKEKYEQVVLTAVEQDVMIAEARIKWQKIRAKIKNPEVNLVSGPNIVWS